MGSSNNPDNIVVVLDDDEDETPMEPEMTILDRSGSIGAMHKQPISNNNNPSCTAANQRLFLWHQIAAHMRRERMLAEQIRAAAGADVPPLMSSPQYYTNANIDPMTQFQAEVLQKQYLLYAHFYHNRRGLAGGNNGRALGVNPASRAIRKPSSSGGAAVPRPQYGYLRGGAMARLDQPFVAAPTRARVLNPGLGLGLGACSGDSEPDGIDLTLKL